MQLESFRLARWASRRRHDLLELLDRLNPTIAELSQAVEQEAEKCPEAQRLMTHPGVGPLTARTLRDLMIGVLERKSGLGRPWMPSPPTRRLKHFTWHCKAQVCQQCCSADVEMVWVDRGEAIQMALHLPNLLPTSVGELLFRAGRNYLASPPPLALP